MLLSYDVTLFAIILGLHTEPMCDRLKCYGQKKCKREKFLKDDWKKIAALNILLAAEKLYDDIQDENSFKAKLAFLLYKKVILKAEKDFPGMKKTIKTGYEKILIYERENKGILELAECFADMMVNTAGSSFEIDAINKKYIYEISRWLYVIDAMDDYDEDIQEDKFNPLEKQYSSFGEIVEKRFDYVQEILADLFHDYADIANEINCGSIEGRILSHILKTTIPSATFRVLNNDKEKKRKRYGSVWRKVI